MHEQSRAWFPISYKAEHPAAGPSHKFWAVGFWTGLAFSELFYQSLAYLTNIPIFMTAERAAAVFVGTILACTLSGILAMRKLAAAEPADLF